MKLEINIPSIPDPRPEVAELIRLVCDANQVSSRNRRCISASNVENSSVGSGSILNGIASAILAIGHRHAPIKAARTVFEEFTPEKIRMAIAARKLIPGFGNSFFPEGDPSWIPVSDYLRSTFPSTWSHLDRLTSAVLEKSKTLLPNAAMYTGIACSLADVEEDMEYMMFILPVIPVWFEIATKD